MSETKTLRGVEVKDADAGVVEAVFSTFNVKDLDGDVTLPGAFTDGAPVRISAFGHASWGNALPVGKGTIAVQGDSAVLKGQFFMDTTAGRETFQTIKGMGGLQEWSYGYDVLQSKDGDFEGEPVRYLESLKVHEVSPVMLGAGIDTRTLAVKGETPALQLSTGYVTATGNTFTNAVFVPDGSISATRVKERPFSDQAETVLGDVTDLISRAKAFGSQSTDEERKEGRTLSAANRDRLTALMSALWEAGVEVEQFLAETDPNKHAAALREIAERNLIRDIALGLHT